MQLMTRLQTWRLVRQRDRNVRRIRAAKLHLENLLENTPRYWRAAKMGGGATIELGSITKAQALQWVRESGDVAGFVDTENAFIALAAAVKPHTPDEFDQ